MDCDYSFGTNTLPAMAVPITLLNVVLWLLWTVEGGGGGRGLVHDHCAALLQAAALADCNVTLPLLDCLLFVACAGHQTSGTTAPFVGALL